MSKPSLSSDRSNGLLAALLFAAAIALGGGGSPSPIPEMALEVVAAVTAILWVWAISQSSGPERVPRAAWIIVILITAVPLVQLVPLPPFIWQALPGRKIEYEALSLINEQSIWRTWALEPARTLSALLSLGPPLLLLAMTSALDGNGRTALVRALAIMAVATLILGALQHSSGEESWLFFYGSGPALYGFQANNNSTADLLLIALMAGPLLVRTSVMDRVLPDKPAVVLAISGFWVLVCAFGVILTSSRTGISLLPIPIIASLWILRPWAKLSSRTVLPMVAAFVVTGPVIFILLRENPILVEVFSRFHFSNELRPQLWQDGLFAARKYFPFGAGMGDFIPAFVADERLASVQQTLPNRAHNELIELVIETGIFGMLALGGISFLLVREGFRAFRRANLRSMGLIWFASAALIILSLHSLVDYPLRSLSLACVAAVCAGLLLPRNRSSKDAPEAEPSPAVSSLC